MKRLGLLMLCVGLSLAPVHAHADMLRPGPMVAVRRPPPPPPRPVVVTADELRAVLSSARSDLQACLETPSRATVRVSLHSRRGLSIRAQVAPRSPTVSLCLDTAVRRWATRLEGRPVAGRSISASLRLVSTGAPPPPPSNTNQYSEAHVHDALDRQREAILRCVPRLAPGTPGSIVLRARVRPDGVVTLEGATLPSGLGEPAVLVCLGELVARIRVPAPDTLRSVTHTFSL